MNSLIHIAPQLPPAIDGVGDYCWNLWSHWPDTAPDWTFLVVRGAEETSKIWREAEVHEFALNRSSLADALELTGNETALLHYVGYAYQPKGIPVWLPGALEQWKRANSRRRLVTMFHEMYAHSSPLRSPFWVAPFARAIIRRIVQLSDAWVTSCERYYQQLIREFGACAEFGKLIAIGSNIPCVAARPGRWSSDDAGKRKVRIVVFGLAKTRLWALGRHRKLLCALDQAGVLESLTLLGKGETQAELRERKNLLSEMGSSIKTVFDLSSAEVSENLAEQDFGLLANEPDIVTKSGVFAALAEHGVIPIVSAPENQRLSTLLNGAVVSNNDRAANIEAMLALLRDAARQECMREQLRALAANELAWPRITESWSAALQRSMGATRQRTVRLELEPVTKL